MYSKRNMKGIALLPAARIRKIINEICYIIEVVDAINPEGTRSLTLERIIGKYRKPFILVLNKIDLLPRKAREAWINYYKSKGIDPIPVSAKKGKGKKELIDAILSLADKCEGKKAIGMVCGVPKTGKSSIINMLKKKESAQTSPYPGKPGYTKSITLYKITGNVYIYDSPGIFPDPRDPIEKIIRSRSPEKIEDPVKPAISILKSAISSRPEVIAELYDLESFTTEYEILEKIAIKRGWVERISKDPLIDLAAVRVIMDYLSGKLRVYRLPPTTL
ncbi:MAG: GTPase RsgA [Fervidicoccaceae archaeon]